MKLPSGRRCAVVRTGKGNLGFAMCPMTKAEAVETLKEWVSVNPQDEHLSFVSDTIQRWEKVNT